MLLRHWFPARYFPAAILVALALATTSTGCNPAPASGDAGDTGLVPAPDGGGTCCPIDPAPGCCMRFGGWSADGTTCGLLCDGIVPPGDPAWRRGVDEHGCAVWIEPPRAGRQLCGAPVFDAGSDASTDASTDASADASADGSSTADAQGD